MQVVTGRHTFITLTEYGEKLKISLHTVGGALVESTNIIYLGKKWINI